METKHTPGPWSIWTSNSYRRIGSDATGYEVLCGAKQRDGWPDLHFPNGGFTGPDARLIAAAPELLEALQNLLGVLEHVSLESGICCCGDNIANHDSPMNCGHSEVDSGVYYGGMAIEDAEKAIAKATGEA